MINDLISLLEEITNTPNGFYQITKNEHMTNFESPEMYYSWDDEIIEKLQKVNICQDIYHLIAYNSCKYEYLSNSYENLYRQVKKSFE